MSAVTTTGGAADAAHRKRPRDGRFLQSRAWRRRLRHAFDATVAFATGHRLPPATPSLTDLPVRPGERSLTELERLRGPLSPGSIPAPVRPGPVDRPQALAHYRAMADQLARERQLTEVDLRDTARPRAGVLHENWFPHLAAQSRDGVRAHG
jgi:hypothetical protein